MKAIATVSMYDMGAANRNGLKHAQTLAQRKKAIEAAAEQRYVEFGGGEAKYTSGTVHALTESSTPIEREFYDFYRTPRGEYCPEGQSSKLTTHPTLSSNVKFMNFYPFTDIGTISPRPCFSSPAITRIRLSSARRLIGSQESPRNCSLFRALVTWTCTTGWI